MGARSGHSCEIVAKIISYLQAHLANFENQMETLLELIYQSYTEFNSVETLEFKAIVNPLGRTLRALVDTDEEADEYMNIVFAVRAVGSVMGNSVLTLVVQVGIGAAIFCNLSLMYFVISKDELFELLKVTIHRRK